MFKKICKKCRNKINKNYDYCPYCGYNLKESVNKEDYGMLGKTDLFEDEFFIKNTPMIDRFFGETMKILEKQMRTLSNDTSKRQVDIRENRERAPVRQNIQLFINGKRIYPEKNQDFNRSPHITTNQASQPKIIKPAPFSEEKLDKLKNLPKKEPDSRVRRIGARVVYELEVPGVNDINNILINRLENSIEIKALSDELVYSKILNVNLPIIRYGLNNGNLILELQGR
jgi:hypothetical protein